jgi:hypothetical protein
MDINNNLEMNIPPTLLIRQLANSTEYSVAGVLPDELMNKIKEKSTLAAPYNENSLISVGYYDKNNSCMILNGRTSVDEYYVRGAPIMLMNYEDGQWVHHTIQHQLPEVGTEIINTETNTRLVVCSRNGELYVPTE